MARFDRPAKAIDDYRDLLIGDEVWHVCGIWQPFMYDVAFITKAPGLHRDHREWSDIHSSGDDIVFDVHYEGWDNPTMNFASDGNLVPGYSHNDNYWFRTKDDAEAAVAFLKSRWEAQPDMIVRAIEDRASLFDDHYFNDDCQSEYDAA